MTPLIFQAGIASRAFWAVYVLWAISEMYASSKRRKDASAAKGGDKNSGAVLVACVATGIVLAFAAISIAPAASIYHHRHLALWTGISLMALGILVRQYAIQVLGNYFTYTVIVEGDQPVIDVGPYKYVRHPSYTGGIMILIGVGLSLTNWASLAVILILSAIGYTYRVNVEEKMLSETIGQPYIDYMKRTKRFIPYIV